MHADKPKKMGPWLVIAALAVVIIGVVAALQYYVKPGRNNLYVRDNVVYKVTIEGAETVE